MNGLLETLKHPLVLPIVATGIIGAVAYVLSRWSPGICRVLALIAALVVLTSAFSIMSCEGDTATFRQECATIAEGGDTPAVVLEVELATSTLGMLVFFGAGAFGLLITVYSLRSMKGSYWEGKFYAYLIWTLMGTCIVALAGNLLVLLVGWEIVTLMLFLMINQGKGDAKSAAAKAYGILGFADACFLLAIALLVMEGGTEALSFRAGPVSVSAYGATGYVVYVLILVAALAKAGAIPFHTWVPSMAKDTPTPVMALLPAALDKLLGIYLLAVLTLGMFRPDATMQIVMMVVGAVTILAAVLMAMMQHNLKKLLSYHAVSQVGYMVLGIGTGTAIGIIGGLFHMLNNAVYKSNLFLMSGAIQDATGTDEIEDMGGLAKHLPITFICGAIAAAAISGIPPLNGFTSKWLVYNGTIGVADKGFASIILVVAVFGSALTLASFVKVMYAAFLSPAPKGAAWVKNPPKENFCYAAPMIVLALACVFLGVFSWLPIEQIFIPALEGTETIGPAVTISADYSIMAGDSGVWSPTQGTVLLVMGFLLGLLLLWIATAGKKVRVVRSFLAGEVPDKDDDRWRIPATHFYETIRNLPLVGSLFEQSEQGQLDPYNWSAKHGGTFVELLRRQHTGLLGLYVSWSVIGLVVILTYLLLTSGA